MCVIGITVIVIIVIVSMCDVDKSTIRYYIILGNSLHAI